MPRLDDPLCGTAPYPVERAAPRPVNPRQPENLHRFACLLAPGEPRLLRRQPPPGARRSRAAFAVLVNPGAIVVAIDARRGQVAHPFQAWQHGKCRAMHIQHGLPRLVRRDGGNHMGHASQCWQRQGTAPLKRQNTAACRASRTSDAPAIGPAGLRQTGASKALAKDQKAGHRCYPKSTSSQTGA